MDRKFTILDGGVHKAQSRDKDVPIEKMMMHFRNVSGSLMQDALDTWGEIWDQMQGSLTHGVMIVPQAENDFRPECGWPEFLERLWLLRHQIDHAKRICEGRA